MMTNAPRELSADEATARPLSALVLEHNPASRQTAVKILEKMGVRPLASPDYRDATAQLSDRHFDFVLMGLVESEPPDATIRGIRSASQCGLIPIILMLDACNAGDASNDHNAVSFVTLPLSVSKMRNAIAALGITDKENSEAAPQAESSRPVEGDDPPLLIEKALHHVGNNMELLNEVIEVFSATLPEAVARIETAADSNDAHALEAAAHSLKGAASNVCAEPLRRLASSIEEHCRAQSPEEAMSLARRIRGEAERLQQAVARLDGIPADQPNMPPPPQENAEPPRAAPQAAPPSKRQKAGIVFDTNRDRSGECRILLVDDNETNLTSLQAALTQAGYAVFTARNGKQAVESATTDLPQLILLDMQMPDMSGVDVCRTIKSLENTQDIPVIFVTGSADSVRIVDAFSAGGCDYVTKPFRIDEILARVAVHIQLRQTQDELKTKNAQLEYLASQLTDLNLQLGHEARIDPLTGLLNRGAWRQSADLEHEQAIKSSHSYAIIMIDVDFFKLYNDTLGHPAGDDCLRRITGSILQAMRHADFAARYGGEEFIIMAPDSDDHAAHQLAEKIRDSIWRMAVAHPSNPDFDRVTISAGVAVNSKETLESTIKRADAALYQAKTAGRNRVRLAELARSDATPARANAALIPRNSTTGGCVDDRIQILIVDDEPTNRLLCRSELEKAGYFIHEACDGVAALDLVAQSPPDVIVMDIMMPNMDGLECTKRLRANPATADIPIIIVSCRSEEQDILAGLKAGANDYLSKPVSLTDLSLRVRSMSAINRSRVELLKRNAEIARSNEIRGEQARAMAALLDLSRSLSTATSCETVYDKTIDAAAQLTGCRRISIMLPDSDQARLSIVRSAGIAPSIASRVTVPLGGEIAGSVFDTGEAFIVNHNDSRLEHQDRYDSDFFVSVPLVSKALTAAERSIGVLNLTERVDASPFGDDELEYLDVLCNLAGAAINSLQSKMSRDAALDSIVIALATLADHRDTDTGSHLDRVTRFVLVLAEDLCQSPRYSSEINSEFIDDLKRAMPLHDIGKVAIPDAILLKPGRLTDEEMDIIKKHPEYGARTIRPIIDRAPDARFLKMAEAIAVAHHEWFDGTGYPHGIAGDRIPLAARLAAVADVYDALTTKRSYKEAFSHERAIQMIKDESGSHFDPDIVDCMVRQEQTFARLALEHRDRDPVESESSPPCLSSITPA